MKMSARRDGNEGSGNTYHVNGESRLAGDSDVDSRDPRPGLFRTSELGVLGENRTATTSSVHGPAKHGTSSNHGDDRFDEEEPAHLARVNKYQGELDW